MVTGIKIIAQHYDINTGEVLESQEIRNDELYSPNHLKDLGYLHLEQIDFYYYWIGGGEKHITVQKQL